MKNLYLVLASLIVGVVVGYLIRPTPNLEVRNKQEVVTKETVITLKKDGTSVTTIKEKANRTETAKLKPRRKDIIGASASTTTTSDLQVTLGYRLFDNLALTASFVRVRGEGVGMVGVLIDF